MSGPVLESDIPKVPLSGGSRDRLGQPACAHHSGIDRVEVYQARGAQYEYWRCATCGTEFRPTGARRKEFDEG